MQALTIWPTTSEPWRSCVVPQLDLELVSFYSCVKTGDKRKVSDFCNVYGHGFLRFSRYIRSCRNHELKCTFFYLGSTTTNDGFSEPTIGKSVGTEELEHSDEASDMAECARPELDGATKGEACSDEHDGANNGGDDEENVQNGSSRRIDVRALAWRLRSATTADDVEEVLKRERKLPLQVYSTMIRSFGKESKLEAAMAVFEWLKRNSKGSGGSTQPNLFIYNSLLGAVKEARKLDFVEDVLNDMAMKGVHPNVVTYNTLMGIYIEQGQEAKALRLLEEMPAKAVTPSPASFSTAMFAYRRLEDGFGAITFFREMQKKYREGQIGRHDDGEDWELEFSKLENFTIRVCYQVMRRWLVETENRSSEVLRLLREMDESGLRHGRAELERLIWPCTREEHCAVAKELYSRIREMEDDISLSVCNHLIWLLGKAKKWWAALEIYEDLLDKGPKPNNMSYELIVSHFNALLSAARKKGIWRWGVRLLNKMEEKGLKPGTREWNSVLVACSKAAETSAAVQIFKRMVEQGQMPTIVSYGALLSALEKGKLYDHALQVWEHMIKVGVEPNLHAYTIMASMYSGQGMFDAVDSIIKEMVAAGVDPTVVTFNAIISACARNNRQGMAYGWFQRMELEGVAPNEVTYEMLIEALARDGKPRLAYELHLRAHDEGLELSPKAHDGVVQSAELYGATVDVGALGPRPPEIKKRVQPTKNLRELCRLADVPGRREVYRKGEEMQR